MLEHLTTSAQTQVTDVTDQRMERVPQDSPAAFQDNDAVPAESTVLLNSAAKAGNWNLVKDLIYDSVVSVDDVCQSFLLQKLASATEVRRQAVQDILKRLFLSEANTSSLKSAARDAILKAAKGDNWDIFLLFVTIAKNKLEDEATLASVTQAILASQTLKEKPFLHVDVFSAVWRHSKQNILSTNDKSVPNTLVQLAAELNMWSRVCDILVVRPDLNVLDRDGLSVLHRLVMCPDSRFDCLLPVLLQNGADVNLKNAQGDTVLHLAAVNQKFSHVRGCLRKADRSNNSDSQRFKSELMNKYHNICAGSKRQALENLINRCDNVDDKDNRGNTAIILAAKNDNWEFARLLMEHGARADLVDDSKRSVLHILALSGQSMDPMMCETYVTHSVNRKVQVSKPDINGDSVPHLAVKSKKWALLKVLIELEARLELADSAGYSAVHRLALTKNKHAEDVTKLFSILCHRGANLELPCADGSTALHLAARQQNWGLVKHLIHLGANVRHCNKEGFTTVHLLAVSETRSQDTVAYLPVESCDPELTDVMSVLDLLIQKGAELEARCSDGKTALHLAARHDNWVMVRDLVQRGANVHDPDSQGRHVLERLIEFRTDICVNDEVFRLILDSYKAQNAKSSDCDFILQLAAKHDKWNIVDHLLRQHGGNVEKTDREGFSVVHRMVTSRSKTFREGWSCCYVRSVLDQYEVSDNLQLVFVIHQAAAAGNVDVVDVLLDNLDDVNGTDSEGLTVLHRVAQCCVPTSIALIRRLVEKGADVEKQCPGGNTAVHFAAKSINWLAVQHLLKYGASASACDNEGMSVLHRLMAQPHLRCKQCLKSPSAKNPALLLAAILSNGTLINQRDLYGNTALHLAAINEHWDMAIELFAKGASLTERDACGCTALHTLAKRLNCHAKECSPLSRTYFQTESSPSVVCDLNNTLPSGNRCVACSVENDLDSGCLFSSHLEQDLDHLHLCDLLVEDTTRIEAVDRDGNTALVLSAKHSNWDITERLLLKGASAFSLDRNGLSLLHILATGKSTSGESYRTEAVRRNILAHLISRGVDVTRRDPEGNTPIQLAAKHGNMNMVEELLDFHQNVDEVDSDGFTLLCRAAMTPSPSYEDIVNRLMLRGADVSVPCPDGRRPLVLSVLYNNWPIASLLWRRNGSRDISFEEESLIIRHLLDDTYSEEMQEDKGNFMFELIISLRMDTVWSRSPTGKSLVQYAFMNKQWDIAEILLEQKGWLDPEAVAGEYVFHYLATIALNLEYEGYEEWILSRMPHRNLNINLRDENGDTPLNILADNDQWEWVELFIKQGADVNMPDSGGWTVVHRLAMKKMHWHGVTFAKKLLELCLEKDADINMTGPKGETAVNLALEKKNWKMFWCLIQAGVQFDWGEADKGFILKNVCHIPSRYAEDRNVKLIIKSLSKHLSKSKYSHGKTIQFSALRAIEKCVQCSKWGVAELILIYGPEVDLNIVPSDRSLLHTMLFSYSQRNHKRWVSFLDALIDKGLDLNSRDSSGKTVLMTNIILLCLVSHKPHALVKVLLERGANPLLVDSQGRSLLTKVVDMFGHYSMIAIIYLLELGMIPYERCLENARKLSVSVSPTRATVQRREVSILKILVECGASSNSEIFALYTECQKYREQTERYRPTQEFDQVCQILEQASSQPRSLESLCRLAVVRCLPCCLNHEEHVRSLPVPELLKDYLLFADVLADSGIQRKLNESHGVITFDNDSDLEEEEEEEDENEEEDEEEDYV